MKIPNMEHTKFVESDGNLTEGWRTVLSNLFTELQQNVSEEGFVLPRQSTSNITQIASGNTTPAVWYDSVTNQPKININGVVKVIQTAGADFNETVPGLSYDSVTATLSLDTGYLIPTTAQEIYWNDAYSKRVDTWTAPLQFLTNTASITQSGIATDGYLSSTDWNIFNNKQNALSFGNLTVSGNLSVSGGTGAVIGSGASIGIASGYVIPTTTEQLNWNNSHNKWTDIQRLGFVNNAQTSISFNDTTYIFTLTDLTGGSGWKYLYNGYEYTIIGNKTVTLPGTPPTAGVYYIYIDSTTGVLIQSTLAWSLLDSKVPVAVIYWNNVLTPKYWLMDERHTCLIDSRDHYYEHFTRGTQYLSGGVLTGPDVTPVTPTDTNNTYGISVTDIADEDLLWTLLALTRPNGITADYVSFYRTSSTTWAWIYSAMPYYYTAAGYINYDNAGTMTQGTSGNYYNSYLLFTNLNGAARYIVINGRGQFASLTAAQAENPGTFDFTGLGIAEFVIAYQFTWRTLVAYGTKGKCRLEAAPKRLNISLVGASVSAPTTSHNSLSGLQGGLSPTEYYHLTNAQWILATQYASATQGGLLSSVDWNTFNNKYPPAGNSAWTYAEGSANYNNRRVRSVGGTGSWRFNFSVPGDFVTLDGVYVVCFVSSGAAGASKNIDFYVEYTNADNQSYNQYTASDTVTTYNLTGYTDKQYRFDITTLFTNLTANSEGGILVDHVTALGGSIYYVGVLIRYH